MDLTEAKTFLRGRKQDYQAVFESPVGRRVLADLARFCRAHATTFHDDARKHAVLEGRREVWLRIQQQLQMSDEQIYALYEIPTQEIRNG